MGTTDTSPTEPEGTGTEAAGASKPAGGKGQGKAAVYQLDSRERLAGFAGAALAAVGFCAIWIPHLGAHATKASGALTPDTDLLIGLVMAAALAGATALGRRALVGFVALFIGLGGPWNSYLLAQIPFLALAGWLLMRASRISSEARRAAQAGKEAGNSRGRRSDKEDGRGRKKGDQPAGRRRPEASKRYTPPKPPRKKVTQPRGK